jgi:hypothetical protein
VGLGRQRVRELILERAQA